jgi:uncharacterized cupredoxin-like copper-binding protein
MPKFLILAGAVALVAAACGNAATADSVAPAPATTTVAADGDHVEGDNDGDHESAGSTETPDRTVEVLMTEFAFDVDPVEVTAGETIEFVVTNAGVVEHEFRVSNQARIDEHLEAGHDDHDEGSGGAGTGSEEAADYVLLLDAGDSSSIIVTFPEDTTLFTDVVCLLPGHYEAGMAADVEYSA